MQFFSFKNRSISDIHKKLNRVLREKTIACIKTTPDKIKILKHRYDGKRCFILGTGPSLLNSDLSKLKSEYVFTVNRGLELLGTHFDRLFGYCIADPEAYRDYGAAIDELKIEHLFLHSTINCRRVEHLNKANIYDSYSSPKIYDNNFQFDLTEPLYDAHTVVLHALQIAVYMGFTHIYFLGVDLYFSGPQLHFYNSSEREAVSARSRSVSNQKNMLQGFRKAEKILRERGIYLFQTSKNGNLNFLDQADFNSLF